MKKCLSIFILLFASIVVWAQDYTVDVQQFDVNNGLLHRDVEATFSDSCGFVWIGLQNGLQRYDGREFKNWTKEDFGVQTASVTALGEDADHWLWIWNPVEAKFWFMNLETEALVSQDERFGDNFPIDPTIHAAGWELASSSIPTDSKGRLVFIQNSPSQLVRYDGNLQFSIIDLPIECDILKLMFVDDEDRIWVREEREEETYLVFVLDKEGNLMMKYDFSSYHDLVTNGSYRGKQQFSGFKNGVSYELEVIPESPEIKERIATIEADLVMSSEAFQLFVKKDEWLIRTEDGATTLLHRGRYDKSLFDLIQHWFFDQQGTLWVRSAWGLSRLVIKESQFARYLSFDEREVKPFNNSVRGIYVDEDSIYACLEFEGLIAFAKNNPDQITQIDRLIKRKQGLTLYGTRPIIKSSSGELVVGLRGEIHFIDGETVRKELYYQSNEEEPNAVVRESGCWSLYEDEQRELWIGTKYRLHRRSSNGEKQAFTIAEPSDDANPIYQIVPEGQDQLWLCTANGLYLFDKKAQKVIHQFGKGHEKSALLDAQTFYCLLKCSDGKYRIGTDVGLLEWDRKNNSTNKLTTQDGLPDQHIYGLFEDRSHRYWLSTGYGLMVIDPTDGAKQLFLEPDGIANSEFNRISAFQEDDGTIYFGGINGITAFHPDQFVGEEVSHHSLQITHFELFDGTVDKVVDRTGELRATHQITMEPGDRYFRLKFALPTLQNQVQVSWGWRLEGSDSTWHVQDENVLQLAALPYGRHTLNIRGETNTGNWSEPLTITIIVLRPFYLQTWFIVLFALLFTFAIALFFWSRIERQKRRQKALEIEVAAATKQILHDKQLIEEQAEELRKLDETKSRFFANITHELRTPLTLILGPLSSAIKTEELSESTLKNLKTAKQNANALLKLVTSLLDLSKLESGKIKLHETVISLSEFSKMVIAGFESHLEQLEIQFSYENKTPPNLNIKTDKEKLETILNNLLSNAAKFTDAGHEVAVAIEDLGNQISFTVRDTGRGIHADDLPYIFNRFYQAKREGAPVEGGTGIGLALCQELAKMMNAQFTVESVVGKGSSFQLRIPRVEVMGSVPASTSQQTKESVLKETDSPVDVKGRKKLLVVEDNHSLRHYIESLLNKDYEITSVSNGKLALDVLDALPNSELPDLILSDIMMPVMDGYQLLERLKAHNAYWRIPVIMLTARAALEDKLKALRIGVDDYLLKPFEEEELMVRISNLLHNVENRTVAAEPEDTAPDTAQTHKEQLSEWNREWLLKLEEFVQNGITDESFGLANLKDEFNMSESTLLRQVKKLTGLTPSEYLREHKLNLAREFLQNGSYPTVSDVAYAVGYKDAKTFSRNFKSRFGKTPSEFMI